MEAVPFTKRVRNESEEGNHGFQFASLMCEMFIHHPCGYVSYGDEHESGFAGRHQELDINLEVTSKELVFKAKRPYEVILIMSCGYGKEEQSQNP